MILVLRLVAPLVGHVLAEYVFLLDIHVFQTVLEKIVVLMDVWGVAEHVEVTKHALVELARAVELALLATAAREIRHAKEMGCKNVLM